MKYIFWIGFAWITYVYAGYAVIVLLLGLWKKVQPRVSEAYTATVSVLISARNEEKDIAWKLEQTLAWDYPKDKLQVLIASDASVDATDEIITSFHDPRVTFVRMETQVGKNSALNELAKVATADILFFTDANSDVPAGCLKGLIRYFADPRVGCVTGVESVLADGDQSALSLGTTTYLNYESLINQLESKIGSVLVCDGSIFCVRRTLFQELSPELANDLELPIRIGFGGHWILYDSGSRSVERCTSSPREEFRRRRRICAQGLLGLWRLRTELHGMRMWQFASRKVLRWFSLLPLVALCISSAFMIKRSVFFELIAMVEAVFCASALLGCNSRLRGSQVGRVVGPPFHFVLALVAALMGMVDTCVGTQYSVWTIAEVSRGKRVQASCVPFKT
jgi:cellulose synthase/poly-beta-1,6-N-acetylglucosamine synthase-like glycosyltransferase